MPIPSVPAPVLGRPLRDGVYRQLCDAIIDGTFTPGEQLRDVDLAAWLGVSRTPVREALLRLEQSGLVVAQAGRSTSVTTLDVQAFQDARDVVAAMHELAVREAVDALGEEDVAAMRSANRRFAEALEAGDADAALRADDELHGVPVAVAGNRALTVVLEQFTPLVRRAERSRFSSASGRGSVERHDQLIRLCENRDVEGAAALAFDTWHSLAALRPDAAPNPASRS